MNKILPILFFPFVLPLYAGSQVMPKEDSKLNYRLIGFSFPQLQNADHYRLEIATGNYNTQDSFKKNTSQSIECSTNRIITEVPEFGKEYTWQVVYTLSHSKTKKSELHHFSTLMAANVDTTNMRLKILKNAEKYKDAYVFLDGNQALYDMKGRPVWFLPNIEKNERENQDPRDLKFTADGTITLLIQTRAYEINYNGDILWKAPYQDKVPGTTNGFYHHQFTKLSNGHYMVMGMENNGVYIKTKNTGNATSKDSILFVGAINITSPEYRTVYPSFGFGTVLEYDKDSNIIWSYKTSDYFTGSDLLYHKMRNGSLDIKVHDNGFYFDEKAKELYISFKDIGRIIKVKYPDGATLNTYGELFNPGAIQNMGKDFFCGQHNCGVSGDGSLYLFNNNACNWPSLPTIVKMQQPVAKNDSLKKIWEYQCTIDDSDLEAQKKLHLTSGGSVYELPDHSIFASMGSMYSKVFILSMNKEILWSALPEKWNSFEQKWQPVDQYRASIITDREQLELLIWNAEGKER